MSCIPSCIKRPLVVFIVIVIVLLILAFSFCSFGMCKPVETPIATPSQTIVQEPLVIQEEIVIQEEPIKDEIVEDMIAVIKRDFIDNGNISDKFSTRVSVLFNRNKHNATKAVYDDFSEKIKGDIDSARLVIISGHACDLGSAEYNKQLIQKRINFVINDIKSKNPAIEILFSNDGQSRANTEKERKEERRVDVYFYK